MNPNLEDFAEYADFEAYARENMPPAHYHHLASGAINNWTRDENRRAYDRWVFRKRIMLDVSEIDLSTEVVGTPMAIPVGLAPSAFHKLAHPEGELASARAAKAMDTVMCLSTLSSTSMEDVAGTGVKCWFQIHIHRDRQLTLDLAARAKAAGYRALAATVDAPTYGYRPSDKRDHIRLPADVKLANLEGWDLPEHAKGEELMAYMWKEDDLSLSWEEFAWLAERVDLPVIAKGIMGADHARHAVESGAVAVWVSNQGGRQMDGEPATLDVLPEVVDAVGDRVDVLVDGGVRDGSHVLKAIALGARAVMIGRPTYWGLAAGGEDGVRKMLEIFRDTLENVMTLGGVRRLDEADRTLVAPAAR